MRILNRIGAYLAAVLVIGSVATLLLKTQIPEWASLLSLTVGAILFLFQPFLRMIALRFIVPLAISAILFLAYDVVQALPVTEVVRLGFASDGMQLDLMVEIFSATISTIYALLVAFLVFKSMQDHDNINITLREEALRLASLSKLLPYFCDNDIRINTQTIRDIQAILIKYADNILSEGFRKKGQMIENEILVDNLSEHVGRLEVEDENDRIALDQLVSRLDSLDLIRSRRISYMESKPSPFMVMMLIILSVFVIAPFYLPVGSGEVISPYFVACLGFSLSFLYFMMVDMSSHFDGYWQVDRQPFLECRNKISKQLIHP